MDIDFGYNKFVVDFPKIDEIKKSRDYILSFRRDGRREYSQRVLCSRARRNCGDPVLGDQPGKQGPVFLPGIVLADAIQVQPATVHLCHEKVAILHGG